MMAQIELDQVHKIYHTRRGPVHAVQDVSLMVEQGEFIALLGPSGCGKTSTLRMIVGLEEISAGDIRFDGDRVNALTPQQRNVATAFESYALYPNFTVAENLGFPLEVRGVAAAERQRQVQRMAEVLRVEDIMDQLPGALSGGQQQRVGLGRALIREPAVLVLDEVLSHIDAHLKFQMLFDLKRIHQELGQTTVFVTHDQMEALALADRVAVMSEARLQQVGTRDVLYHAPATLFVADFIGEPPTNFFTVSPAVNDGQTILCSTASNLKFHPSARRAAALDTAAGGELIVGLRPQNVRLQADDQSMALTAEVLINEYLGEQTILTLKNGEDTLRALAPPDVRLGRGDSVTLYYAPEDVLLFDKGSEKLIA